MTDKPAAIQASFSDFRLIKGRKQAQIILEIPIEGADAALAALGGIPQPHSDRWVAVARLNGGTYKPTEPVNIRGEGEFQTLKWPEPDKRKADTKLSLEAVMRCKDVQFHQFLRETYGYWPAGEAGAAEFVRDYCKVDSRSGLNTDPVATSLWREIDGRFLAWKSGLP